MTYWCKIWPCYVNTFNYTSCPLSITFSYWWFFLPIFIDSLQVVSLPLLLSLLGTEWYAIYFDTCNGTWMYMFTTCTEINVAQCKCSWLLFLFLGFFGQAWIQEWPDNQKIVLLIINKHTCRCISACMTIKVNGIGYYT